MSDDIELRRRMAAAAAIELQGIIDALREVGAETERVTGYRVVSPERPSITDAKRSDLERMLAQVLAGEKALRLALGWLVKGRLGDTMKVMPQDAADELTAAMVAAGLLPPQGES